MTKHGLENATLRIFCPHFILAVFVAESPRTTLGVLNPCSGGVPSLRFLHCIVEHQHKLVYKLVHKLDHHFPA